jgi:hypothetical protein
LTGTPGNPLPEAAEDELEIEEEADDLPPIDAPVSWDAEAKAVFATLPRERKRLCRSGKRIASASFSRSPRKRPEPRQEVEQAAYQQLANTTPRSRSTSSLAEQFSRSGPIRAAATRPAGILRPAGAIRGRQAQRRELQQQAENYAQQASSGSAGRTGPWRNSTDHRREFPEYADPTTGPKLQQELSAVARELGYPPELIGQARATDIIAMRKVAELKAKADKYDA